jgi:hypothetical protein
MLEARTGKRVSPRAFIFQTLEALAREYDALTSDPRPPPGPARAPAPAAKPAPGLLRRFLSLLDK